MPDNAPIKTLLLHARLIYLVKYQAVKSRIQRENEDLYELNKNYTSLFGHFYNPKLWEQNITFVAGKTSTLILDIDSVDPGRPTVFITNSKAFYDYLTKDLLKEAIRGVENTDTSTWNLRMLSALRITLQKVDDRKAFFKNQGTDLDEDPDFQALQNHQRELVATYRGLLTSNAVEADESKVNNMKQRGVAIEGTTTTDIFIRLYTKLSDYIDKQIADVSEIQILAEGASENNQQTINALLRTLLKMDQKIATMASAGKDFTRIPGFDRLSADQAKFQKDFINALQTNAIETTDADVGEIDQIGNNLDTVDDISEMKQEYQALNKLMRSKVDNIA